MSFAGPISNPITKLSKAADALCDSADPMAREVGEALAHYLDSGAAMSIDSLLGLRTHGGIGPRRALVNADRDTILMHLARVHPEWSGLEPSVVARRMVAEFKRYESGRWKRDRTSVEAPAVEPAAGFWRILRSGARMPDHKRLRQILSREIQDPL